MVIKKLWFVVVLLLVGCGAERGETAVSPTPPATTTAIPLIPTPSPTLPPAPPLPSPLAPTPTPTTPPLPSPTTPATPHPIFPYTIAGLRADHYSGGSIRLRRVVAEQPGFTQAYIDYLSDGLTITGMMHTPSGAGPFPVVILLHGYIDRDEYWAGADTWQMAELLAQNGYIAIAPDLRTWGESDSGVSLFHTGLVRDVVNLISSLPSLPQADVERVGLWGHSMGGGVATKVLLVDERVKTAVLYAPNSADDADLIGRWGPGCLPGQSEAAGDKCNPGDFIPADLPPALVAAYLSAAADPVLLRQIAPIYHLDLLTVPLQIHIGLADGAALEQTPPEWAEKLYGALQAAGKEATYFTYPDQGHFFLGESWQLFTSRALAHFAEQLR